MCERASVARCLLAIRDVITNKEYIPNPGPVKRVGRPTPQNEWIGQKPRTDVLFGQHRTRSCYPVVDWGKSTWGLPPETILSIVPQIGRERVPSGGAFESLGRSHLPPVFDGLVLLGYHAHRNENGTLQHIVLLLSESILLCSTPLADRGQNSGNSVQWTANRVDRGNKNLRWAIRSLLS